MRGYHIKSYLHDLNEQKIRANHLDYDDDDDDDSELSCGMIGQQKVFSSLVLFPGETISRDSHHHESLTRYQQGFNLCRA